MKKNRIFQTYGEIKVSQEQFMPYHSRIFIVNLHIHSHLTHTHTHRKESEREREKDSVWQETRKNSHIWKSCSHKSMRLSILKWGAQAWRYNVCMFQFFSHILRTIRSVFAFCTFFAFWFIYVCIPNVEWIHFTYVFFFNKLSWMNFLTKDLFLKKKWTNKSDEWGFSIYG